LGQKTNPIGLRLGISRTWDSNWFARGRDFARYIKEDEEIRRYVYRRLERAQLSRVIIERKPQEVNVVISTARPGLVIGSRGSTIDSLTSELKHLTKKTVKIKVNQVEKPETDAMLVADNVARQLENRVSVRRAMKRTISDTMRAGAEGIKITCSGRLGGAEMSRVNSYHEGRVPLHTLRADIDFARGIARTTYGVIGVMVWIYNGEVHEAPVPGS
jgi:small subunit ribosomal protein S3